MDVRHTWPTVVAGALLLAGFALLFALTRSGTEGDGESLPDLEQATIDAAGRLTVAPGRSWCRFDYRRP